MISSATSSAAPLALAPHHLRLFALIIDYLLAIVVLNLAIKASLGTHWDLNPQTSLGDEWPGLWFATAMLLLLAKDGLNGRSPGKWFMGIAVARANDPAAVPGLARLMLRNLTLAILPLEAVAVFVDRYYRRLGDRLAGTVVHRWLQRATDGETRLESDTLESLRPTSKRWLQELGVPAC